jgi:hypothetical protein
MHHAFQYPANVMAMWIVVMAVTKQSVTRPDLAKCAKLMSFAVPMVVPALRSDFYVTSRRTVLRAPMRSIVVSCHFEENWFKHFAYYPYFVCVYIQGLFKMFCPTFLFSEYIYSKWLKFGVSINECFFYTHTLST